MMGWLGQGVWWVVGWLWPSHGALVGGWGRWGDWGEGWWVS